MPARHDPNTCMSGGAAGTRGLASLPQRFPTPPGTSLAPRLTWFRSKKAEFRPIQIRSTLGPSQSPGTVVSITHSLSQRHTHTLPAPTPPRPSHPPLDTGHTPPRPFQIEAGPSHMPQTPPPLLPVDMLLESWITHDDQGLNVCPPARQPTKGVPPTVSCVRSRECSPKMLVQKARGVM